jgi:hypothetical protein
MKYVPIKLSDFSFKFTGHGHYRVTYFSPNTTMTWTRTTTDMQLIDNTKNCDYPKQKDLKFLKKLTKS